MKTLLFTTLLLSSIVSSASTYSIPGDLRFCTQSGSDIKAIANMGYVVKKNGAEFHLTAPRGDEARLGAADIAALEAGRTSQDKKTDKIIEASENTFFSRGQIDGLFKFTEVKLQSGHKVGILKSANGGVIIQGSTKNCK